MSEQHFVRHLVRPGDYVRTEFRCTAPVDSRCRVACKFCWERAYEQCCCSEEGRVPTLGDAGACNVMPWLDEGPSEELYSGPEQPVRGPGWQQIVVTWNGDYYEWTYAEPA
ncbi:hypothetical protein SEA_BLACKBEETLE_2 [Mycobacterium phage Blackbeetle]|uniref:Uncharacterized protein n=2 Tax=Marvinvirus mosmoris TaxID=1982093 RepID=A0A482MDP5_9CAUD|nr:hypothetical protein SEA_BLACKBEETLE_2 [Mycobacterium phage Blackbeetle]QFP94328.1 hypothetical protein SEA_POISE_2 [Mycobacterium phage Poise]